MRGVAVGVWIVLVGSAALLGLRVLGVPLLDPDESRFARTSVEMARSGDLVVPTYEGSPRLVKPPLLHWIQSALFRSFGATEWIARLPACLATLGSVLFVAWMTARRFGGEATVWAAAMFATMPLVLAVGGLGTLDALLSVHVLAILALDLVDPEGMDGQRAFAVGCLLGICFLIKGPVGVVLPVLAMLAGRTASGREVVPRLRIVTLVLAGSTAVTAPWFLAVVRRVGVGPLADVVRREALERYFAGTDHVEPFWYLAAVLAVGCFPWAGVAAVAIVRTVVDRRDPATRTARYLSGALLAGLVFFSLGRSKLATYVLPLAPLVATLAAWELGRELAEPRRRRAARVVLAFSLGLAAAAALVVGPRLGPPFAGAAILVGVVLALGALLALFGLTHGRPRVTHGAGLGAMVCALVVAMGLVLPVVARQRTSAYLARALPEMRDPTRPLVIVSMKVPSLSFYLDRIPEEVEIGRLDERLDAPDAPVVVFDEDDLVGLDPRVRARLDEIGREGKYVAFVEPRVLDAPPGPG